MATCSRCGGFKPEYGLCPTCAKMESDRELAEKQIEANEELARRNMKVQAGIAAFMAADAQKKHDALMEQEEVRLKELKKQTQILLEQGLSVDEVYQKGFNFEEENESDDLDIDRYVQLELDDRGNIIASYENPYVQDKFRKAYKKGIEDRLKKDYSKGPGTEFMSEGAFNHGYLISEYCPIFFTDKVNPRFLFAAERQPVVSESVNQEDGSLECNWVKPYDSDLLNQSFEAGINKYLKEQNTLAKKTARLDELKKQKENTRVIKVRQQALFEEEEKKKASAAFWKSAGKAIAGAATGAAIGAMAAIPIYFFLWFFSIFFGGISWTFWGFLKGTALISAILGLFVGKEL